MSEPETRKGKQKVQYVSEIRCPQCNNNSDSAGLVDYSFLSEKAHFIYQCKNTPTHTFLVSVSVPISERVRVATEEDDE